MKSFFTDKEYGVDGFHEIPLEPSCCLRLTKMSGFFTGFVADKRNHVATKLFMGRLRYQAAKQLQLYSELCLGTVIDSRIGASGLWHL